MDQKNETPSARYIAGQPKDSVDMVNKYGTYNIQPTNDSDNEFPEIAQGLPTEEKNKKIPRSEVRRIFHERDK